MTDALLARVGHIAVAWNEAEHIINRLLWLYLDTDTNTADILTKPMRAADREKLLGALVTAKEIDQNVADEIREALRLCKACRDNRNTILHNAGGGNGAFNDAALEILTRICEELNVATNYLRELQASVTRIIISRAGRETPIGEDGDESSNDELLPLEVFERPNRPERPVIIAKDAILPEGYFF